MVPTKSLTFSRVFPKGCHEHIEFFGGEKDPLDFNPTNLLGVWGWKKTTP